MGLPFVLSPSRMQLCQESSKRGLGTFANPVGAPGTRWEWFQVYIARPDGSPFTLPFACWRFHALASIVWCSPLSWVQKQDPVLVCWEKVRYTLWTEPSPTPYECFPRQREMCPRHFVHSFSLISWMNPFYFDIPNQNWFALAYSHHSISFSAPSYCD